MEDETNTDPLVSHRETSKANADKADNLAKNKRNFNESRRQTRAFNRALAKEKNNALQNARSTTERRAIKAKYKEALKPLKPRSAYGDLVGYDEEFTEETSFGEEDGLPSGYEERTVILCENGEPVTGEILFKEE